MKKDNFVIYFILILLLAIVIVYKNRTPIIEREEPKIVEDTGSTPRNINELISYDLLDDYKYINKEYWDQEETIVREESYESQKNYGYFTASIFSYKNIDPYTEGKIFVNEYINNLVHKNTIVIDGKIFYVGYSGLEDVEDAIGRAYVTYGNYVFEFSMTNNDESITEEQYDDFINIIKSIKFK